MDAQIQHEIDRLWEVMQWMAGGFGGVFLLVVGHLHVRISGMNDKVEEKFSLIERKIGAVQDAITNKFDAIEDIRRDGTDKLWAEQRKQMMENAEWRAQQVARLAALPTREEIRDMLSQYFFDPRKHGQD